MPPRFPPCWHATRTPPRRCAPCATCAAAKPCAPPWAGPWASSTLRTPAPVLPPLTSARSVRRYRLPCVNSRRHRKALNPPKLPKSRKPRGRRCSPALLSSAWAASVAPRTASALTRMLCSSTNPSTGPTKTPHRNRRHASSTAPWRSSNSPSSPPSAPNGPSKWTPTCAPKANRALSCARWTPTAPITNAGRKPGNSRRSPAPAPSPATRSSARLSWSSSTRTATRQLSRLNRCSRFAA